MDNSTYSSLNEPQQAKRDPQDDSLLKKPIKTTESERSQLLAWCSKAKNMITVIELETKQKYVNFEGVQLKLTNAPNTWTFVKGISNTSLLVSAHHEYERGANMEVFDISLKGKARKIYSFEEVTGKTGVPGIAYNARRNVLGAISVAGKTAYHLFNINYNDFQGTSSVKLLRKTKWTSQKGNDPASSFRFEEWLTSLDFDPSAEFSALLNYSEVCLISNLSTGESAFKLELDGTGRCRWSLNIGEPLLFVKYQRSKLNIFDVEKQNLTLKLPVELDTKGSTLWIDVNQNDKNLLAAGGHDKNVTIYDRRVSKVVKIFEQVHEDIVRCVIWNPSGNMLATSSDDKTTKLIEFGTGKINYTATPVDGSCSVCFI